MLCLSIINLSFIDCLSLTYCSLLSNHSLHSLTYHSSLSFTNCSLFSLKNNSFLMFTNHSQRSFNNLTITHVHSMFIVIHNHSCSQTLTLIHNCSQSFTNVHNHPQSLMFIQCSQLFIVIHAHLMFIVVHSQIICASLQSFVNLPNHSCFLVVTHKLPRLRMFIM